MDDRYRELFQSESDGLIEQILPLRLRVGEWRYMTRAIKAGEMLELECYPVFTPAERREAREARKRLTPEQMEKINQRNAEKRIVRLANANFTRKDNAVTLTFREPVDYDEGLRACRNFIRRLKRLRERRGLPELKYIYSVEDRSGDGERRRTHVHMLLTGGIPREEIEALWGKGFANVDRLQPDEHGLARIARYISKQQKNRKRWVCSNNLKKPTVRRSECKLTNRKVRSLAERLPQESQEILEKLWPGYYYVECSVKYSDYVGGVYVAALMRKKR
ncbi:MAG: hypothetical protein IKN04_07990 [Clostridia bacterium]|nr:hypothetical protein [Clostridia bacterium]